MSFSRHPLAVGSQQTRRHFRSRLASGFTLLEAQIAVLVFAVAMVGMVGGGRVYKKLLVSMEKEHRLDGVALDAGQRTISTVTYAGTDSGDIPCELRLHSVEVVDGALQADVYITRR